MLPGDPPAEQVAESIYDVQIRPGILYQPHPAFARDEQGRYRYHAMKPGELGTRRSPLDFEFQGTREAVAEDYVYALKRHATTRVTTPIFSVFADFVVGLRDYGPLIKAEDAPGELVAESIYDVPIKRGILFQPHPAFAKDEQGRYYYHAMKPGELGKRRTPLEFAHQGTRELVADDFVYALKRHATTRITAPIFSTFAEYVVGLKEYGELIKTEDTKLRQGLDPASQDKPLLDFRQWPLAGASAPEKHLLRVRIKGKYPQWSYWMQMTFMAPVPGRRMLFMPSPAWPNTA